MKAFLQKIAIFSSIFGLSIFSLNYLIFVFEKQYVGNETYSRKYSFLTQHQKNFNAVLLGSSLTYRQISPKTLDASLTQCKTSSFNLGANGMFNPETYYLYESLLDELPENGLDYAFLELEDIQNIEAQNLATARSYYWHNWRYLLFSIDYILDSNKSLALKSELLREYFLSYVYKVFLGFRILLAESPEDTQAWKQNGFYAFDDQMNDPQAALAVRNSLKKESIAFLKDTSVLKGQVLAAEKGSFKAPEGSANVAHLHKLLSLIKKSKAKGVHLIFFVPPRLSSYIEAAAIAQALPKENVIEVFDPIKYPELYQPDLSFDKGHLNAKGAEIFTKIFAEAVDSICLDQ
ncbi:MAG: hypothetical protein WA885_22700 [Phormidesmis sp.]